MVAHGASRGVAEREPVTARRATLSKRQHPSPKCRPPGYQRLLDLTPRLAPWANICRLPG